MSHEYTVHSMMHVAEAQASNLSEIDRLEDMLTGYKYSAQGSTCKIMVSGGSEEKEQPWKLMIYGGTSTEEAEGYIQELGESVEDAGGEFELTKSPVITNLAVSGELGTDSLNLEGLSVNLTQKGFDFEYEPEQFPALQFYMKEPECTFLLFSTGSYVIQGLREFDDIPVSLNKMGPILADSGEIKSEEILHGRSDDLAQDNTPEKRKRTEGCQ